MIAIVVTAWPVAQKNILALSLMRILGDVAHAPQNMAEWLNDRQLEHEVSHLVGALLLRSGNPKEAARFLQAHVDNAPKPLKTTGFLLGEALLILGKDADAGEAFQRAGLYDDLQSLRDRHVLGTVYGIERLGSFARAAQQAALAAYQSGDWLFAREMAMHATHLAAYDLASASDAFRLLADIALAEDDPRLAATYARQSLDTVPPANMDDERYAIWIRAVAESVFADGCQVSDSNRSFALLVAYSDASFIPLSKECQSKIVQSITQRLTSLERAFVYRRLAAKALAAGENTEAGRLLDVAEGLGLPVVWRQIMLSERKQVTISVPPAYEVEDQWLAGYDIDPLQVELGLSIEIVLHQRGPDNEHLAQLVEVMNLAPNPGFEYGETRKCQFEGCQPLGFETDIYNGSQFPDARTVKQVARPVLDANGPQFESHVLKLSNAPMSDAPPDKQNSSLQSFSRSIAPGARYLQAGWMRAEGGNAFLGRLWPGTSKEPPYDYASAEYSLPTWRYVSQVVQPPTDAFAVKLWMLNFQSTGDALFDGGLLIQLP